MRMILLIFAALGALAACLVLVLTAGAWRLKELAATPATQPTLDQTTSAVTTSSGAAQNSMPPVPSAVVLSAGPVGENLPEPGPPEGVLMLKAEQAKLAGGSLVLISPPLRGPPADGQPPRGEFRIFGLFGGGRPNRVARGNMFGKENFEPFITRWSDEASAVEWTVSVPKAGKYAVQTSYSLLSRKRDGGTFVFSVGNAQFEHDLIVAGRIVEDDFYDVGQVTLPAGETKVTVRPSDGGSHTSLFLRSVRLVHVD